MKLNIDNTIYETKYFPFHRKQITNDFIIFGLTYPSGKIDEIVVFSCDNYYDELKQHLIFLIKEFLLEDDEMLTPKAKSLKEDLNELFNRTNTRAN